MTPFKSGEEVSAKTVRLCLYQLAQNQRVPSFWALIRVPRASAFDLHKRSGLRFLWQRFVERTVSGPKRLAIQLNMRLRQDGLRASRCAPAARNRSSQKLM